MDYGVTPQGFVKKTLATIIAERTTSLRAALGDDIDTSAFSYFGLVTLGIEAQREFDHYERLEQAYYNYWVDTSEGVSLDRAVALRGVSRLGKIQSLVDLEFSGDDGTTVAVGVIAQTAQAVQYITTGSGIISGGVVTVSARALVAGVSGNVGATQITEITTVVPGLSTVNNPVEAAGGREVETDPELRARYKLPNSTGGSSAPAIQAVFAVLDGVIGVKVFENDTDVTVGLLTPHTIRVVIDGVTEQQVFDTLVRYKPAGTGTIGSEIASGIDNEGVQRDYKYDNSSSVDIYCDAEFTIDTVAFNGTPAEWLAQFGSTAEENIIKVIGGTFNGTVYDGGGVSKDVESWEIIAGQLGLPFVVGAIDVKVAKTVSPTLERVPIADDEKSRSDVAKLNITAV